MVCVFVSLGSGDQRVGRWRQTEGNETFACSTLRSSSGERWGLWSGAVRVPNQIQHLNRTVEIIDVSMHGAGPDNLL